MNGNVPCAVETLLPFERQLRILCDKKASDKKRRRTLNSLKGTKLLREISRPIDNYFKS